MAEPGLLRRIRTAVRECDPVAASTAVVIPFGSARLLGYQRRSNADVDCLVALDAAQVSDLPGFRSTLARAVGGCSVPASLPVVKFTDLTSKIDVDLSVAIVPSRVLNSLASSQLSCAELHPREAVGECLAVVGPSIEPASQQPVREALLGPDQHSGLTSTHSLLEPQEGVAPIDSGANLEAVTSTVALECCPPLVLASITLEAYEARQVGEESVRALNGVVDTETVLHVLYDLAGAASLQSTFLLRTFGAALITIKQWARAREIYGSLGFCGGFAWTMLLVSHISRLAADASNVSRLTDSAHILTTFFQHYASWDWTQAVGIGPWPAKYRINPRRDLICITTCSSPVVNVCPHFSFTGRRVFRAEFNRAAALFAQDVAFCDVRAELCAETGVLVQMKTFLRIAACGVSDDDHEKSRGFVRSRILGLCYALERTSRSLRVRIWPHTLRLPRDDPSTGFPESTLFFIGLQIDESNSSSKTEVGGAIGEFVRSFEQQAEKTVGMACQVKKFKRSDIPQAARALR